MSNLNSLLDNLYGRPAVAQRQEDPALEKMAQELEAGDLPDLSAMSVEELTALARRIELEKNAGEVPVPQEDSELVQVLGGQIMAHAHMQELALIKVAMIQGKCRICKERVRDVPKSSICSHCARA